jgi:hypothetical protein
LRAFHKMKTHLAICIGILLLTASSQAENRTDQTPITMEQLMHELQIQGGNFQFSFDKPVFARVTTEVSDEAQPAKKETLHFTTASANKSIFLFFSASPRLVGNYSTPQDRGLKMLVKLSDCKATEGTRVIYYQDRLVGDHAKYSPAVPPVPQVGKQYTLHWYYKDGDPYSAKAVIEFSETPFTE